MKALGVESRHGGANHTGDRGERESGDEEQPEVDPLAG